MTSFDGWVLGQQNKVKQCSLHRLSRLDREDRVGINSIGSVTKEEKKNHYSKAGLPVIPIISFFQNSADNKEQVPGVELMTGVSTSVTICMPVLPD